MAVSDSFFWLVDKPAGLTSQKVLTQLKKRFGIKKIGHHGTLDPFATGLLLVGVNQAPRFFNYTDDSRKTYQAVLQLGMSTNTLDLEGEILEEKSVPQLSVEKVKAIFSDFIGEQNQIPPMFSAVKIKGQKLYEMARQGVEVERSPRKVTIHSLELNEISENQITFTAEVSRGTYIRVLGDDLAKALGTLGHLVSLRRTVVCDLDETSSVKMDESDDVFFEKRLGLKDLLKNFPLLKMNSDEVQNLYFGRLLARVEDPGVYLAESELGDVVGVLESSGESVKSLRLVAR